MTTSLWLGVGVLLVIVFLVFAAVYANYRATIRRNPAINKKQASEQRTIHNVAISVSAFLSFLVAMMVVVLLGVLGLRKVEQKNLFNPTKIDRYRKLSGVVYSLPSGALVVNTTPNAPSNARRILFISGNAGNLENYRDAFAKIAEFGYNMFALEYRGFGPAKAKVGEPNADTVVQDAQQAWDLVGTSDGIVAGFSLGGAVLSQVYEKFVPQPAQIVFLNSFGDIAALLEDKLGQDLGGVCAPLMRTRWSIKSPTTYNGRVLVVMTADDLTINSRHGERLCQVFSKSDLVCTELPRGGHKYSVFTYVTHWIKHLLPPIVPQ